jgi:hypothetical protein
MKIKIDLDGGCMPLYSSKFKKLTLKQEETTQYAEIPYQFQEIA